LGGLDGTTPTADHRRHLGLSPRPRGRGTGRADFEEEMQTMITFAGGEIDLGTLYHENMHQWWATT
jgi:hypothetical protein